MLKLLLYNLKELWMVYGFHLADQITTYNIVFGGYVWLSNILYEIDDMIVDGIPLSVYLNCGTEIFFI